MNLHPKDGSDAGRWLKALGNLAVGLVLGAGVALLLAPRASRELREYLRSKMRPGGAQPEAAKGAAADSSGSGS